MCPECGGDPKVCGDAEKAWYPQMVRCHKTAERLAAERAAGFKHAALPYHDGNFSSWSEEADEAHPYHFSDGVTIFVADTDLGLGGDFLPDTTRPI